MKCWAQRSDESHGRIKGFFIFLFSSNIKERKKKREKRKTKVGMLYREGSTSTPRPHISARVFRGKEFFRRCHSAKELTSMFKVITLYCKVAK